MPQDMQIEKIYQMGQVCLETQIALAIQFLSAVDQEVGDYLDV